MRVDEGVSQPNCNETYQQESSITLHAFADLTHVSPLVYLHLLKECYIRGTCKASAKFRVLQQQVHQSLYNTPKPAVFIAHCLYMLPIFESYSEGFSHLIISALRRFLKINTTTQQDLSEAKLFASQLFIKTTKKELDHDEKVLIKILEAYSIGLKDIENAFDSGVENAKSFVEQYIFGMIESESYMTAVTLLEHFNIRQSGESFLYKMMESKEYRAAQKWAVFMGKSMLCILVQKYVDRNLLKYAYELIKKNNLKKEFPDVYHKGKESSLKKLAEKGLWDVAEARINGDKQLLEYLVYLAMEAGYSEKVDELCERYSLKGFNNDRDSEASLINSRYLQIKELELENIIWVDNVGVLNDATIHLESCKVVGIDCEWKPNYEKGSKPNKVSIMQIASEKNAYIFDLIKLNQEAPEILDNCLACILQSPRILKLGYNFQCDVKQLSLSYGDLDCFKHYAMLLDIQNVFKEPRGGLSGLAKKILGAGLNKTRRNSNWEQRPLSQNQLEYAAIDAVVLIHIFWHVRSRSPTATVAADHTKIEWKSQIVSRMDNPKKSKKQNKIEKEDVEHELVQSN